MENVDHDLQIKYKRLKWRYQALFEGTREIVFTCLPAGEITDINLYGVKALGYTVKSELIGRNFIDFYHNPGDRNYYNLLIRRKGYLKDFEVILKKANGEILIGLETSYAARNKAGAIIEQTGIIKDVTARVKQEMLLRKQNMDLQEINNKLKEAQSMIIRQDKLASLGQLAAGVAHEINNPLSFVKSSFECMSAYVENFIKYLSALEQHLDPAVENRSEGGLRQVEALKKDLKIDIILDDFFNIFRETNDGFNRITSIINNLKNFSHVDNNKQTVIYDLNQGIESTLQLLNNEIKYGIEVEKRFSDLPRTKCYGGEINQVLLNIIMNALQAIKNGNEDGSGKIVIGTEYQNGYLNCTISDNGPGIPEEVINKIFDPFFTTKEVGQGTGLGLTISYDIVKNHNGELLVESNVGTGTQFIMKLPVV